VDVIGWQKWFGAAVLGFAYALGLGSSYSPIQLQGLLIGTPAIMCYNQSINDCFDVEIDQTKAKLMGKKPIVTRIMSRKEALSITFTLLITGLVSTWIASTSLFVINLAAAFLGTVYSAPPFRLKMKYPFSTIIQFVGCFLPFLAGVASISNVTLQAILISTIFAALAIIHRFAHEIKHYEVDLQTGKETVAVTKGVGTAKTLFRLSGLIGVAEFVIFFVLGWFDMVFSSLFTLYLAITIAPWVWLRHTPKSLRTVLDPVITFSGFVSLAIALLVYWQIRI